MLIGDSVRVMTEDVFTIKLTRDQTLVLSDWLYRMMYDRDQDRRDEALGTAAFEGC